MPDLEKYKAVQFFSYRKIEIRRIVKKIGNFFLKLKLL